MSDTSTQAPHPTAKPLPRDRTGALRKRFEANGHTYLIIPAAELPIARWRHIGPFSAAVGYGTSFADLHGRITNLCTQLDAIARGKGSFLNAAVVAHNLQAMVAEGAREDRVDPALGMCTIFIVREGEALETYDPATADEKIADWTQAGYRAQDFLDLALASIEGWASCYADFESRTLRLAAAASTQKPPT